MSICVEILSGVCGFVYIFSSNIDFISLGSWIAVIGLFGSLIINSCRTLKCAKLSMRSIAK